MSPLKPSFAQKTTTVPQGDWRTATPQRSRTARRRTPHAAFVMRALELFPGSTVLESFPHPVAPTAGTA